MKERGIVRRLDELGRIVIPKELRRTMRLKDGDEIEITATGDSLTLKKYSGAGGLEAAVREVAAMLATEIKADVVFISGDKAEISEGQNKKSYEKAIASEKFSNIISERRACVLHGEDVDGLFENVECFCCYAVLEPIASNGEFFGTLALILDVMPGDLPRQYLKFAANILAVIAG